VRTIEKGVVVNVLEEGKEKMRKEGDGNWVSKGRLKGKGEMEGRKREREEGEVARRVERSARKPR